MKGRKEEVYLGERFVGTLVETADRHVAFAYSDEWLETGFAISPFSLPVGKTAGMGQKVCRQMAEEIQEKTHQLERRYRNVRS